MQIEFTKEETSLITDVLTKSNFTLNHESAKKLVTLMDGILDKLNPKEEN